jgi:hypothetical protein
MRWHGANPPRFSTTAQPRCAHGFAPRQVEGVPVQLGEGGLMESM